jgi:hypothetical protein
VSCDSRTERLALRETALNMFTMSRSNMALVGAVVLRCLSKSATVECIVNSSPLGVPVPNWACARST